MAITKVTEGARTLGTGEVTTANMATDPTNASTLASGTVGSARMGTGTASSTTVLYGDGSWKAEPTTDTTPILNDIATLALNYAISENKAAFNLANAFVDQFEDSSGVDTTSTVQRDSTTESMVAATESPGGLEFVNDSNTQLLYHFNGADASTTFTDSSSNSLDATASGNAALDTAVKQMGTASYLATGTNPYIVTGASSALTSTGDFTVESWVNSTFTTHSDYLDFRTSTNGLYLDWHVGGVADKITWQFGDDATASKRQFTCTDVEDGNWHHIAVVRDSDTAWYFYYNGVSISPDSGDMTSDLTKEINDNDSGISISTNPARTGTWEGWKDEFRFSNSVRYPGGTTFVPNPSLVTAASGNYTSTTQASVASVSSMGIVVLYKNQSGTATLNTDLVAQVSANGGTNYANATLVAGGTFSTGINIAAVSGVSVTAGTTPKYKISFANQSSGSKETQVHGVALLY